MQQPAPLLKVNNLSCSYKNHRQQPILALENLSFSLPHQQNLGILGQSGSGKSSLIKSIAKLIPSQSEHIIFNNQRIDNLSMDAFKPFRKEMQLIFQDPHSSFNPYLSLKHSLLEPLHAFPHSIPKNLRLKTIEELLLAVGLDPKILQRYPRELSGGMAQRMSIARSLLLKPKLILADEPVSALDFIIQAQIINLLSQLQERYTMSYLIISHSLAIIKELCQDTLILYQGKMSEYGATTKLLKDAIHPYTRNLIMATQNPLTANITPHFDQLFHWQGQNYSFYPYDKYVHYQQLTIAKDHWLGLYTT